MRSAPRTRRRSKPSRLRVRYIRVNYAKADEELVKKVQEVLTERGTATWDERTNTIVVRDIARGRRQRRRAHHRVRHADSTGAHRGKHRRGDRGVRARSRRAVGLHLQFWASPEIGNASRQQLSGYGSVPAVSWRAVRTHPLRPRSRSLPTFRRRVWRRVLARPTTCFSGRSMVRPQSERASDGARASR